MENTKYNGWTNYATWRVNLEMFDGGEWESPSADFFRDMAEELILETSNDGLARDYAMAFLSEVNWHEIANHYNEEEAA